MPSFLDIQNTLINIADGIREFTGTNESIKGSDFLKKINDEVDARASASTSEFVKNYLNHSLTNVSENDLVGIKILKSDTFRDQPLLTTVNIPEGVEIVEDGAFYNCSNLSEVVFPSTVKVIENYSFYLCPNLSSLTIKSRFFSASEKIFKKYDPGTSTQSSINNIYLTNDTLNLSIYLDTFKYHYGSNISAII